MKKRKLKNLLCSKITILIILITFIIFILMYLSIKNEFFYNAINYINTYISYYVSKYLDSDIEKLIVNNQILLYVENDTVNIFSALYFYVLSFGTLLFKILMFLLPISIFYNINKNLNDEFYKGFIIPQISRVGKKRYLDGVIMSNGIWAGLILIIPKILYLLVLCIFFPVGVSSNHFISTMGIISQPFLYVGYSYNPYFMIIIDLVITFIYGFVLSLISILITGFINKKPISYLLFIFIMAAFSILPMAFSQAPLISYISIYNYFYNIVVSDGIIALSIYYPLLYIVVFCIILFVLSKILLKRRINKLI